MTTDNKKYYQLRTTRWYDYIHGDELSSVTVSIATCNGYRQEEPCCYQAELDYYTEEVESYETLDEVKSVIEQIIQLGCGTNFKYSALCEADRKSLSEYISEAKQNLIDEVVDIYRGR